MYKTNTEILSKKKKKKNDIDDNIRKFVNRRVCVCVDENSKSTSRLLLVKHHIHFGNRRLCNIQFSFFASFDMPYKSPARQKKIQNKKKISLSGR